jgi:hypothetical protein
MNESRIRPRTAVALKFAVIAVIAVVAIVDGTVSAPEAGAGRTPVRVKKSSKACYYGGGIYSLGACRDGQRCVRGTDDEDYWEDGQGCTQTGSGTGGGFRQV